MGKAVAFVVVAALTVFLILRFATPLLLPQTPAQPNPQPQTTNVSPQVQVPAPMGQAPGDTKIQETPPQPIEPPRSTERRTYEDIEAQRAPFYAQLQNTYQFIITVRPAPNDQTVLEIYMTTDDEYISSIITAKEITPSGSQYGFEKVQFFQPNMSGGAERYRLDGEATVNNQGLWTFTKH